MVAFEHKLTPDNMIFYEVGRREAVEANIMLHRGSNHSKNAVVFRVRIKDKYYALKVVTCNPQIFHEFRHDV